MSNEQEACTRLDRAIDETVHAMMHVDQRPGLRHRVLARIASEDPPAPWTLRSWLPAAGLVAATVILGLAAVLSLRQDQPAAPVAHTALPPAAVQPAAEESAGTVIPPHAEAPPAKRPAARQEPQAIFRQPAGRVSAAAAEAGRKGLPVAQQVRIELSIGQGGAAPEQLTLIAANGHEGRARTGGPGPRLFAFARPVIQPDGRLRVDVRIVTEVASKEAGAAAASAGYRLSAVIEEGGWVVMPPADAATFRVEVKGTVLR